MRIEQIEFPFYIFTVGLPGVGKSTLANEICMAWPRTVRIERDIIRNRLYGIYNEESEFAGNAYYIKPGLPRREMSVTDYMDAWFTHSVKKKQNIVHSDAHMSVSALRETRKRIKKLRDAGYNIYGVVMNVPLDIALERNEKRKDTLEYVSPEVIRRMYENKNAVLDYIHTAMLKEGLLDGYHVIKR